MIRTRLSAALAILALSAPSVRADEGMWTFDNFPSAAVNSAYGATVDQAWLDRVQRGAVRLTSGCSASLVSNEGLVLTNHHCVVECVQDLSTAQEDLVKNGFLTAARSEERRCPGIQAEVLTQITDVTARVKAAAEKAPPGGFVQARDAEAAAIETASCKGATERCQVVSLYRGGQYKLYKYRKYTDARLVFAPELQTAFFGGDPDNFNFPRYNLDSAFLRLYENGRPAATPNHLRWNAEAPKAGDLVFVAGNPGGTDRLLTVSQLETQRDLVLPIGQLQRSELRGRLIRFSEESAEHKRIATDPLFGVENSFKVFYGRQFFLNDPKVMADKRRAEAELRAKVAANPRLAADIGDPWGEIAAAQGAYAELYTPYRQLEQAPTGYSDLYRHARTLVRGAQERAKPAAERLPEFSQSRLPLVERSVTEATPVDAPLEELYLGFWLSKTREYLTVDDPNVKRMLGKESPEGLARRLVSSTRLADPAVRKALWEGGLAAIQASDDPMIRFVLATDQDARAVRRQWETRVSGPVDRAAERVAQARFAVYGEGVYPDATFTLRLSYGKVAGWTYRGRTVEPFTTFAGLYERATGAEPFALAQPWIAAQSKLNPATVFNISSTNDIIGGNSGSPLINARGEVIGAVFDGNIHSLGGNYGYDPELNRSVTVSTAAITEALDKVYGRQALVKELTGR
jgi:V8-like Glu-specific endopeptidase